MVGVTGPCVARPRMLTNRALQWKTRQRLQMDLACSDRHLSRWRVHSNGVHHRLRRRQRPMRLAGQRGGESERKAREACQFGGTKAALSSVRLVCASDAYSDQRRLEVKRHVRSQDPPRLTRLSRSTTCRRPPRSAMQPTDSNASTLCQPLSRAEDAHQRARA